MAMDLDDVLGYYTVKYVKVKDRYLGIIQKLLMLLIFVKILCLTIVYQCHHLLEVPVIGSARAGSQQPTMNGCNPLHEDCMSDFTPLSKLPYCTQFKGAAPIVETARRLGDKEEDGKDKEEDKVEPGKKMKLPQADCVYWDAPAMTRGRSPVPGTLFMPTRVTETDQVVGCQPSEANGWKCDSKPWVHAPGDDFQHTYMIADVERFTILINQAFAAANGMKLSGRAADFDGFVKGRPDLEDFYAKRKGFIAHMEKDKKDDLKVVSKVHPIPKKPDFKGDFKNVFSLTNGDVFSVDDILTMADIRGADILDEVRDDGSTMRSEGGVISIDITYSNKKNLDILGQTEPVYTISAKYIPMKYYKIAYEELTSETTRKMHSVHGLLILMEVKGAIRVFSISNLLTVLCTAMVSLALARTLTDVIMSYAPCLGMRQHYDLLKYQPTLDFGDLRERINELKDKHKDNYKVTEHKASACAGTLNDLAKPGNNGPIPADKLLGIVCTFEQRLNHLDGVDTAKVMAQQDEIEKCVHEFKRKYCAEKEMKVEPPLPPLGPAE